MVAYLNAKFTFPDSYDYIFSWYVLEFGGIYSGPGESPESKIGFLPTLL